MKIIFRKKFEEMEKSRLDLFRQLDSLSEHEFIFKSNPANWSITQIIFHLVKSEQLTFITFSKNLENKEKLKDAGFAGLARHLVLSIALKSPFKFKAPALLSNMPEKYEMKELQNKWNSIRENFNKALENFPESIENKTVFNHPKAGWLNTTQMLDFLKDHFDHHNRQIQNLIEIQKQN